MFISDDGLAVASADGNVVIADGNVANIGFFRYRYFFRFYRIEAFDIFSKFNVEAVTAISNNTNIAFR